MNSIINYVNYKLTRGGVKLTKPYNISIYKEITIDKYLAIDNFYL